MLTFVCLLATLLTGSPSQAADQPQVSKRVPLPVGWKEKPKPIGSVPKQPSCTQEKISGRADGDQRFLCLERKSAKSAKKFSIQSLPKVWCTEYSPRILWGRRDGFCFKDVLLFTVIDTRGRLRGDAHFAVQTELTMKATEHGPATVREHLDMKRLDASGEAKAATVQFTSTCKGCTKTTGYIWKGYSKLPTGKLKQKNMKRTVDVAKGKRKTVSWGWRTRIKIPKAKNKPISYSQGGKDTKVRCDNEVGKNFGCVNAGYIPTLGLDVAKWKAGALFIARAQQENQHHWGMEKYKKPLTRLANEGKAEANREVICPKKWKRDPRVEDPSCDEFPFARTYQSGGDKVASGEECEQRTTVHIVEGDGSEFLEVPPVDKDGNILEKGNPNALCVRATTPKTENKGVGSALGGFTKKARLLNKDKYWVYVYISK